jgi:hypothetical protein
MRVFVSQTMKDLGEEQIKSVRAIAENYINTHYKGAEILDTYFEDYDGNALGFLGMAISALATADVALFLPGWEKARGCKIEHTCAEEYGIEIVEL